MPTPKECRQNAEDCLKLATARELERRRSTETNAAEPNDLA
jgi:hypothetical protein